MVKEKRTEIKGELDRVKRIIVRNSEVVMAVCASRANIRELRETLLARCCTGKNPINCTFTS